MIVVLTDDNGTILARASLAGLRWISTDEGFLNSQPIHVTITESGFASQINFENTAGDLVSLGRLDNPMEVTNGFYVFPHHSLLIRFAKGADDDRPAN